MYKPSLLIVLLLLCLAPAMLFAQQIKGIVQDRDNKASLSTARLINVYSNDTVYTDAQGNFSINANKGELIEIKIDGYNPTRFRLSQGHLPSYFKLYLDKVVELNTDKYASSGLTQYQIDSIKSHELYRPALDYARMSDFEQVESPFTALSRNNREKWRFQESYALFEKEKFIDFTYNPKLVKELTGLEGSELDRFMKLYRPSYEALRSMSLYDFYSYIRRTAEQFRWNGKPSSPRNSG